MEKNLGGHELGIQDSGAPRGERNHWEVVLNGVVLYSDFNGKKANKLFDAVESALTDMAPKRAQLPSQGGEAVAMRQRFSQIEDEIMAGKHTAASVFTQMRTAALYTHPADQVEDDLNMVKVWRELLQDLRDLAFDQVEHHRAAMGAYKQTRQSAMDSVLAQADALLRS